MIKCSNMSPLCVQRVIKVSTCVVHKILGVQRDNSTDNKTKIREIPLHLKTNARCD